MSGSLSTNSTTFSYDGSKLQTFTAPEAGTYEITAIGAGGGGGDETRGGFGAEVSGTVALTANETLSLLVGAQGATGENGGGGGGSFVVVPGGTPTPLVIAGGGGGGGAGTGNNGGNGGAIASSGGSGGGSGTAGTNTFGGGGGGGGGLTGNGSAGETGYRGEISFPGGGYGGAFITGAAGGTGSSRAGSGGYGGGGGSGFDGGGGGGGGYTGGAGGSSPDNFLGAGGLGGTSYDSGTNRSFSIASTLGNGSVTITELPAPDLTSLHPSRADFGRLLGDVLSSPAARTLATDLLNLCYPKVATALAHSGQSASQALAVILHDLRPG